MQVFQLKDKIVYYPIYMIMFVDEALIETPIIKKLDLSDI